jgi:hypothetical protein
MLSSRLRHYPYAGLPDHWRCIHKHGFSDSLEALKEAVRESLFEEAKA